jgi:hypothetical protein
MLRTLTHPNGSRRPRLERPPLLSLESLFVVGERVVVSGSVRGEAAASAKLEVKGVPVPLGAQGSFCATVELEGESALTLALETGTRERIRMQIPLRAAAR